MKFRVTMKTPDGLDEVLSGLSEDDYEQAKELADRYFEYQEILTIEFDTEHQTATVLRK